MLGDSLVVVDGSARVVDVAGVDDASDVVVASVVVITIVSSTSRVVGAGLSL